MEKGTSHHKHALIQCNGCGRFFWARLATEIFDSNQEEVLFTNYRSCFNCGNQGYIEGMPVKVLDQHGEVSAIIFPKNDFPMDQSCDGLLVGFAVFSLRDDEVEIPCYSYFFEWEVAREQEKEKAGKGKVISFYKNI